MLLVSALALIAAAAPPPPDETSDLVSVRIEGTARTHGSRIGDPPTEGAVVIIIAGCGLFPTEFASEVTTLRIPQSVRPCELKLDMQTYWSTPKVSLGGPTARVTATTRQLDVWWTPRENTAWTLDSRSARFVPIPPSFLREGAKPLPATSAPAKIEFKGVDRTAACAAQREQGFRELYEQGCGPEGTEHEYVCAVLKRAIEDSVECPP